MIFWVLSALVTAAVLALILRPVLSSDGRQSQAKDPDIAIYQDQLAEIERDKERGILNEDEANSAKLEVSRRILTAADKLETETDPQSSQLSDTSRVWVAGIAAGAVTVLTMVGYLGLGSPGLPGQPYAERARQDPRTLPVQELIARVEARLKADPNDARGWDVIAPIYLKRKDYRKAANAYQRSLQLNGESPRRLAQFAEAVLGATNGFVNDTVKSTYERLVKLKPDYHPARFWLAVRHEQQGQREQAVAAYSKLLGDTNLPGQMRGMVRQRLAAVSNGNPPAAAQGDKGTRAADAGRAPELNKEARQSMAALTPEQRQQRIRQMVDGLAQRLKSDGGELSEWQRLIRAYSVLGDHTNSAKALKAARTALAAKPDQIQQLDAFAKSLGIKQ